MELFDALRGRRTIHHYEPQSIDPEAVQVALEAAQFAPNHRLTFPWRFLQVGPETRQRLFELNLRLKTEACAGSISNENKAKLRSKMLNPALLMVVNCIRCSDPLMARENYAAVACAVQNFMLALWDKQVGSKWGTGGLTRHPDTYSILGVSPEEQEIAGFIWAGIPQKIPRPPERPPLSQVFRLLA